MFDGSDGSVPYYAVGTELASGTPSTGSNTTYTFTYSVDNGNAIVVQIPDNTADGEHSINIFSTTSSSGFNKYNVGNFKWYAVPETGQPIKITVEQTDTTPPVITTPGDLEIHVGTGETGAVVDYVVTATDEEGGSGLDTPVCDPASGSTFPIGDTVVTCTAKDVAGNEAVKTFTVSVLGPTELVEDLADTVVEMNLHNGIENSLDSKLDAALNALDDLNENNDVAAINSLYNIAAPNILILAFVGWLAAVVLFLFAPGSPFSPTLG